VTHDCHDRWARCRLRISRAFAAPALDFVGGLLNDFRDMLLGLDLEALGDSGSRFEIDLLVDRRHDALVHQRLDDVDRAQVQRVSQFGD
jgi:hypothetical protein